jgi:6,7-dimethyl-8-ribityllumazine synthase
MQKISPTKFTPDSFDGKIAFVIARFHDEITSKLYQEALETLKNAGLNNEQIDHFFVPGAFEIPLVAKKLALTNSYRAIITLGCVIRGDTPHFDYVCAGVTNGIVQASLETMVPIVFGVLTTNTMEQAVERTKKGPLNKGAEAAFAALEICSLLRTIP